MFMLTFCRFRDVICKILDTQLTQLTLRLVKTTIISNLFPTFDMTCSYFLKGRHKCLNESIQFILENFITKN